MHPFKSHKAKFYLSEWNKTIRQQRVVRVKANASPTPVFLPHQIVHKQIILCLHSSAISLPSPKAKNGAYQIRGFFKSPMKTNNKYKVTK